MSRDGRGQVRNNWAAVAESCDAIATRSYDSNSSWDYEQSNRFADRVASTPKQAHLMRSIDVAAWGCENEINGVSRHIHRDVDKHTENNGGQISKLRQPLLELHNGEPDLSSPPKVGGLRRRWAADIDFHIDVTMDAGNCASASSISAPEQVESENEVSFASCGIGLQSSPKTREVTSNQQPQEQELRAQQTGRPPALTNTDGQSGVLADDCHPQKHECESQQFCSVAVQRATEQSHAWATQRKARLQRLQELRQELATAGQQFKSAPTAEKTYDAKSNLAIAKSDSSTLSTSISPCPSGLEGVVGPASVYIRGELWLEKKRQREQEMRDAALRAETSECTFWPSVASSAPVSPQISASIASAPARAPLTAERARQLFDRQVSWRQQLDEAYERRRRELRETEERELREQLRRSASPRPRSPGTRQQHRVGGEEAFAQFYARNQRWQRARDERAERLIDEAFPRRTRPSGRHAAATRPRSQSREARTTGNVAAVGSSSVALVAEHVQGDMSSRSSVTDKRAPADGTSCDLAPPGVGGCASASAASANLATIASPHHRRGSGPSNLGPGNGAAGTVISCAGSVPVGASWRPTLLAVTGGQPRGPIRAVPQPLSQPHRGFSPGRAGLAERGPEQPPQHSPAPQLQPRRCSSPALMAPASVYASSDEHAEVMDHMKVLQKCLIQAQSQGRTAGWQKALRVDRARLNGAGAAPLRSVSLPGLRATTSGSTAAAPAAEGNEGAPKVARGFAAAAPMPTATPRGRTRSPGATRTAAPAAGSDAASSRGPGSTRPRAASVGAPSKPALVADGSDNRDEVRRLRRCSSRSPRPASSTPRRNG